MGSDSAPEAKRVKRTYRACYNCRSRKLKCSFGDPDYPWQGPCERCRRQQRECILREVSPARETKQETTATTRVRPEPQRAIPVSHSSFAVQSDAQLVSASAPPQLPPLSPVEMEDNDQDDSDSDEDLDNHNQRVEDDALVSSNLQNPSDALKLLATASSINYTEPNINLLQNNSASTHASNNVSIWKLWAPITENLISVHDARALFSFFELEMAPLYPLVPSVLFEPDYLETLVKKESLLLGVFVAIAARYSEVIAGGRGSLIHTSISNWVRQQLLPLFDGDPHIRNISAVEALLLLSEWPLIPVTSSSIWADDRGDAAAKLLRPSLRYEAYSWSNIGWAVRLAQELGLHESILRRLENDKTVDMDWKDERILRTWFYCYNADRHVSVRLGRNAVLQAFMPSQWWEKVSSVLGRHKDRDGSVNIWGSDIYLSGALANLIGSIQERIYPNKEVTRTLLRTGTWEHYLRSIQMEIAYFRRSYSFLERGSLVSALFRIEIHYVVLYSNSIALKALQQKLRRRRKHGDPIYDSPVLFNLREGPWIMDALTAARSIVELTLSVLEERGILRLCPSRTFQYIIFAATFLYKALATGVVEHGEQTIVGLLDRVVTVIDKASIDDDHFPRGFAQLLTQLGQSWRRFAERHAMSASVLNRGNRAQVAEQATDAAGRLQMPIVNFAENVPQVVSSMELMGYEGTTNTNLELPFDFFSKNGIDSAAGPSLTEPDTTLGQGWSMGTHQPMETGHDQSGAALFQGIWDRSGDISISHDWQFRPTQTSTEADLEQDALFQSIWDSTQTEATVSTPNAYATLLGNVFGTLDDL